jgi:lantibiotic modifying enzyme
MSEALRRAVEPIDWLEEAGAVEDQILSQARRTPEGEVIWLHSRSFREGADQPARLGSSLYDGVTGVALFLAAMESIEPREGRRDCILSALSSLRRELHGMVAQQGVEDGPFPLLGGLTGLGGCLYGFGLIGRWLGEQELIQEAAEIATLITPERIMADAALDVMSGCAGAALALLALDRMAPEPLGGWAPIDRAVACGERLLGCQVETEVGPRAWSCNGKPPRFGYAHGAAGIADCLIRLFECTGDSRFLEAAEEGLAFEHLHYDAERGDWPLPGHSEMRSMNSWCNGAPGIALGCLGMLTLQKTAHVEQDFRAALRVTRVRADQKRDTLCCGHTGNVEVLLQSYKVLGEEQLFLAAEEIASAIVAGRRERERLPSGSISEAPGFFRGAAGVGYTFLRLAFPFRLPCVLSMAVEVSG